MGQHTPGPWFVEETNEGHEIVMATAIDPHGPWKSHHIIEYKHGVEGRTTDPDDRDTSQYAEAEANAHLIAGAPDLLAVAVALDTSWTENFPEGPDGECRCGPFENGRLSEASRDLWRKCRAAIAKAEGRA